MTMRRLEGGYSKTHGEREGEGEEREVNGRGRERYLGHLGSE